MSNKKFTTLQFVAGLDEHKGQVQSAFMLSHPYINVPAMDGLMTDLRLKLKRSLSSGLSRPVMEIIALWLKKCLLMQPTTKKFGLRLLMATG